MSATVALDRARTNLREAGERRAAADKERSAAATALAKAVRQAAKRGMGSTDIAREAGVSRMTVHNILRDDKGNP